MQRAEVAQCRCELDLTCDLGRAKPIDLVQRDHDGRRLREGALGNEPVAGADLLVGREHEADPVHLFERGVDDALHALGERIAGPLKAGQVDEHELPVLACRDALDPAARGLGLVGDDRHLRLAQHVHEG